MPRQKYRIATRRSRPHPAASATSAREEEEPQAECQRNAGHEECEAHDQESVSERLTAALRQLLRARLARGVEIVVGAHGAHELARVHRQRHAEE